MKISKKFTSTPRTLILIILKKLTPLGVPQIAEYWGKSGIGHLYAKCIFTSIFSANLREKLVANVGVSQE